jgi:5'-nucleotidase
MTRILVSNDDGLAAAGLTALVEAVSPLGEVWVVAPEHEQSATSHSLSLHRPLRIRSAGERRFGIDGTPADCVYAALTHIMRDTRPTLVVSGINHGPNLADDVIYSGTVAAAMEASILGVPAIAFSLVTRRQFDFTHARDFVRAFVGTTLKQRLPERLLLNVNMPAGGPIAGYQMTRLGQHSYGASLVEKEDPRGRKYYWVGGTEYAHVKEAGTDVTCVHDDRMASITPLMVDLTHHQQRRELEGWVVEGYSRSG